MSLGVTAPIVSAVPFTSCREASHGSDRADCIAVTTVGAGWLLADEPAPVVPDEPIEGEVPVAVAKKTKAPTRR
jgi:hypothetical protein